MAKKSNQKKTTRTQTPSQRSAPQNGATQNGAGQNDSGSSQLKNKRESTLSAAPSRAAASRRTSENVARENLRIDNIALADNRAWSVNDPRFWRVAMGLLLVGITLRQIQLMAFPYSHDEAIHAWFAEGFSNYSFDPIYHGPVLYHIIASIYAILGKNDFTARLAPSLLGIALLAITIGPARRWLGPRGALWCLGLLVISPVIVTYHRHLIHDSLVMTLTMGSILCFQAALENPSYTRSGRWSRLGLVSFLALFIATKANSFFIIAMLGSYWVAIQVRKWWLKRRQVAEPSRILYQAMRFAPLVAIILFSIASGFGKSELSVLGIPAPSLFPRLSVLLVIVMWLWLMSNPASENVADETKESAGEAAPGESIEVTTPEEQKARQAYSFRTYLLSAYTGLFIYAFFFGHGYLWWRIPVHMVQDPGGWATQYSASTGEIREVARRGVGLGAAFAMQRISSAPPESHVTWIKEAPVAVHAVEWFHITDAMPKMLTYWIGQQREPRLPSRNDYYIVLMALYELPIAIVALCAIARASRERSGFTDLLLWWAFTSYVLYALANEKVPWLLTHIMLPLILLAGWWLGKLRFEKKVDQWSFVAICGLGAIFLLRNMSATNFERAVDNHEPMFYAQTTEKYRDALFNGLIKTQHLPRTIWAHNDKQWPAVWYLRKDAPYLNKSGVNYGATPPAEPLRMAISTPEEWQKQQALFQGWQSENMEYMIWPRASWPALHPARFVRWWFKRDALTKEEINKPAEQWEKSILCPPGEWSVVPVVVGTPP